MTEPDEALIWAREQSVQFWESLAAKGLPPETIAAHVALARSGGYDCDLENEAEGRRNWLEGYRAGQAASAERIKALEGLLNHAEDLFDWAAQSDCENGVRSLNKAAAATYLADAPATKAAILEIRELTRALHVKEPTHD